MNSGMSWAVLISHKVAFQLSTQNTDKRGQFVLEGILDFKEIIILDMSTPNLKARFLNAHNVI